MAVDRHRYWLCSHNSIHLQHFHWLLVFRGVLPSRLSVLKRCRPFITIGKRKSLKFDSPLTSSKLKTSNLSNVYSVARVPISEGGRSTKKVIFLFVSSFHALSERDSGGVLPLKQNTKSLSPPMEPWDMKKKKVLNIRDTHDKQHASEKKTGLSR